MSNNKGAHCIRSMESTYCLAISAHLLPWSATSAASSLSSSALHFSLRMCGLTCTSARHLRNPVLPASYRAMPMAVRRVQSASAPCGASVVRTAALTSRGYTAPRRSICYHERPACKEWVRRVRAGRLADACATSNNLGQCTVNGTSAAPPLAATNREAINHHTVDLAWSLPVSQDFTGRARSVWHAARRGTGVSPEACWHVLHQSLPEIDICGGSHDNSR